METTQGSLRTLHNTQVRQYHFWSTLKEVGFARLNSEANIYKHNTLKVFMDFYVDDLLTVGVEEHMQDVMSDISKELLLKYTGQLHDASDTVKMLGRMLQRSSDVIMIYESLDYYTPSLRTTGYRKRILSTPHVRTHYDQMTQSSYSARMTTRNTDVQLVSYNGGRRYDPTSATLLRSLGVAQSHQLHITRSALSTYSGIYEEQSTTSTL